jgi:hypothetical protein
MVFVRQQVSSGISWGEDLANRVRQGGFRGEVDGVFSRALNLLAEDGRLFSVTMPALGNAPNRVLVQLPLATDFSSWDVKSGTAFCCIGASLLCVGDQAMDLTGCTIWREAEPCGHRDLRQIRRNLAVLQRHVILQSPPEGLGRLLLGPPPETEWTLTQADRACNALFQALPRTDPQGLVRACSGMVGLGPGLTPSGDDFLTGIMLGLYWGARAAASAADFLRQLEWAPVLDLARNQTNRISFAQIEYASQGRCNEAVTDLLRALCGYAGEDLIISDIDKVLAIGSTSGCDILAGIGRALAFILSDEIIGGRKESA